jgi:hypothetical protein
MSNILFKAEISEPNTIYNICKRAELNQDIDTPLWRAIEFELLDFGFVGDDAYQLAVDLADEYLKQIYAHGG